MRIEQFRVDGFGRLAGLEVESLGSLVAVVGPNEAGKSTLFHFLTTALYGFKPASRDKNPHVPWSSDEAGGSVLIRLSDGRCAEVERRLRSSPRGVLRIGSEESDLRNQPVPWVNHVPHPVFRQVFAITLAELAGLDSNTWLSIQDRVLGSMGASDLRGARSVAEQLEQEAGEIWRPSRRGNQRLRDLKQSTRALRNRRQEALERDRRIRTLVEERENERVLLSEARTERQAHKVSLEVTTELLPVRRRLERVEQLREEGGGREELARLPERLVDTVESLRRQAEEARRQVEDAEGELAAAEALRAAVTERHRGVLDREGEIHRFGAQVAGTEKELEQRSSYNAELAEIEGRSEAAITQLLDRTVDEDVEAALDGLSLSLLRDRIQRLQEREGARGDDRSSPTSAPRGVVPALVAIAAGVGLWIWGVDTDATLLASVGGALAAVGLAWGILVRARPGAGKEPGPVDEVDELRSKVRLMLAPLPLRNEWLDRPTMGLVEDLGRLRELRRARGSVLRRIEGLDRLTRETDESCRRLAETLSVTVPGSSTAAVSHFRDLLAEAQRVESEARAAERDRVRLERNQTRARTEAERLSGEVAALMGRVFEVTGATDIDAVEQVQRRLVAHAEADRLERELLREHPDLDELRERIRQTEESGVPWNRRAEEVARLRSRIEELDTIIEAGVGRAEALDSEVANLRRLETADSVDSALIDAQESERALARERDKKWVMAQLIREADRRFREEHQPDLIRRASDHLRTLTDGRYQRLLIDESGGNATFQLVGPGLPHPIPLAAPISTGTIEQAYLSLRLAIVDHLDEGSEALPLFVDEAFVNWDSTRRDHGLDTLSRLAQNRQIFAFTCHPRMAARLEEHGARVLELER